MLKSGEAKSLDLWNRIDVVGAVSSYSEHGHDDYNVALHLQLNKVNLDGPSLKFSAGFSVSKLPYPKVHGVDLIGMPENTSKFS
jgi:hypothetical protein